MGATGGVELSGAFERAIELMGRSLCGCCQSVERVFYEVLRSYVGVRCVSRVGFWHR